MIIPRRLLPEGHQQWSDEELAEWHTYIDALWDGMKNEYRNRDYADTAHGKARTYDAGCRGPACLAANRARARKYSGHEVSPKYLIEEPIIEWMLLGIISLKVDNDLKFEKSLDDIEFWMPFPTVSKDESSLTV